MAVAETKRCPEPQRAALWTVDQDESGARTIRDERGELRARYHDAAGMAVGLVFALQSVQHEKQARERAEAENKRLARGLAAAAEIARLDPCEYDHHGLCQTHNMQPKGECWAEVVLACEAAKESGQ